MHANMHIKNWKYAFKSFNMQDNMHKKIKLYFSKIEKLDIKEI